jgi:large subunit ribosomal protein L19
MKGIVISPVEMDLRKQLDIHSGDTVSVDQRIYEGKDKEGKEKFRIQSFEGLVLAVKHGGEAGGTFTVRKVASGVGVEKIFPLYTPMIDKITIIRRSKVRRAKLYYIREKVAREVKRSLRRMTVMNTSTDSYTETKAKAAAAVAAAAQAAE